LLHPSYSLAHLDKLPYSDFEYTIYGYNFRCMRKGCIVCDQVLLATDKSIEQIEKIKQIEKMVYHLFLFK
jgi:hypothetical protein